MTGRPRIVVTLGDPCGIGPELLLRTLPELCAAADVTVAGARAGLDLLAGGPIPFRWEAGGVLETGGARVPFLDPTPRIGASDLVLGRSGGSIFEVTAAGRPAILVPYPHATADHQSANAAWMQQGGAATVLRDEELSGERLVAEVDAVLGDSAKLERMAAASRTLARPDAARAIAAEVLRAVR